MVHTVPRRMQGATMLSPQAQAVQNLLAAMPVADRQAIAAGVASGQANSTSPAATRQHFDTPYFDAALFECASKTDALVTHTANYDWYGSRA